VLFEDVDEKKVRSFLAAMKMQRPDLGALRLSTSTHKSSETLQFT